MPVVHRPAGTSQGGQFAPAGLVGSAGPAAPVKKRKPKKPQPVQTPHGEIPAEAVQWRAAAAKDHLAALRGYTGRDHGIINDALRHGRIEELPKKLRDNAARLSELFDRTGEFPQPVTVYRGISGKIDVGQRQAIFSKFAEAYQTGQAVRMKGFQSTSLNERVASSFAETSMLLEVRAKKGLYLEGVTRFKDEHEILLNHGSTFRVRNITTRAIGGDPKNVKVIIHMDQES